MVFIAFSSIQKPDVTIKGELEHRRVKRFFSRTNKVAFTSQITKHERRERMLWNIRLRKSAEQQESQHPSDSNGLAYLNFEDSDPLLYTDPAVRYHISNSMEYHENLTTWLGEHKDDPAFRVRISFSFSSFYGLLMVF